MTGCRKLIAALLLASIASHFPAHAEPQTPVSIAVTIDEARLIRLAEDVAQVIVGNPSIADVAAQGARLLVVTGKSYGSTNLIALDSAGRTILSARLGVAPNDDQLVTVYRGTLRQSLHCAPDCQHVLTLGDDKTQFEQLAESVQKKFGVANSAAGGQ
jgi:Flp pilus assembly secretin CpaC